MVLESGFIFIRESRKEGEGDCSMQGGGAGEERVLIWYIGLRGGLLKRMEYGHLYKERQKFIIELDWKMLIVLLLLQWKAYLPDFF